MSEIRNQLKSQSLDQVLPSAFKQVGGVVFPDASATINLNDLFQIVNSYRAVHAPSYGHSIPNTGLVAEGIEHGGGLDASDNEAYKILAIEVSNGGGGAPIEFTMTIGGVLVAVGAIPPAQSVGTNELPAIFPFTIVKGNAIKFNVVSGTASDFSAKIAYNKTSQ